MNISATMDTSTRWIFMGNILCSVGLLAISIGTTLRMAREGTLPAGRLVTVTADPSHTERPRASDYFS